MRVGLFGGSFDPPHRGHLAVAQAVRDRYKLDRVLLAPAAVQPLKRAGAHASFADRLRMVELLCQDSPGLQASDIDGPRPQGMPNYTIDTVHRLQSSLPPGTQIFLIVGADAFLSVRHWKNADALLDGPQWIVVSRPGFDLGALDCLGLSPHQRTNIHVLSDFASPVSATEVRDRLHEQVESLRAPGEPKLHATDLVPTQVLEYIIKHHLYGT